MYSPKELESNFNEIINPNKPSSILGTIYKHSSMKPYKLNGTFLDMNFLNHFYQKSKLKAKLQFWQEISILIV